MKGYWKNEPATEAALHDGWLHTGDIGELDEDGYLQITDRKKDIIVLSGGDNVSPGRVEGFLTLESEISQAMAFGNQRPHLVALLVPDDEFLAEWAKEHNKAAELAAVADDPALRAVLGQAVERVNAKLANVERVRRFTVAREAFSVENEMMTPTLKVRRHKIVEAYRDALDKLYEKK
jgi:long-chain acyl-CoA synthetase